MPNSSSLFLCLRTLAGNTVFLKRKRQLSTIVVVKKKGVAVIGTDTLTSRGTLLVRAKYKRNCRKIHRINESYIGLVGSIAHHNVLDSIKRRYAGEIKLNSVDNIFETFLTLHGSLKDEYYVNIHEEKEQEYESNQLHAVIANPYGIFEIQSYREVMEYSKFWAIGTGNEFALGSLHSIYDLHEDPKKIAEMALRTACEFDGPSGLPIKLHSVKLMGRE